MANLVMLKTVRRGYTAKDGFDVHPTSKHAVASPLPDQFKGAWFCLKKGFFDRTERQEVECYPLKSGCCASGKVTKNLLDVVAKGKVKIKENFEAKLYDCFADLRYKILMS